MSCLCEKLKPKDGEWSQICIGQLWVFEGLRQAEVEAVVRGALRQRYQVGQSVFMQGDTAKQISLIKAGRVKLSKLLEERLYRVLLNVAREHGEKKEEGYVIQFPLTHEDLGFLIGAHRVSITRVMKRLKDSGKILQMGRKLVLPLQAMT
jgi:CRP-like cAMP-binding protein